MHKCQKKRKNVNFEIERQLEEQRKKKKKMIRRLKTDSKKMPAEMDPYHTRDILRNQFLDFDQQTREQRRYGGTCSTGTNPVSFLVYSEALVASSDTDSEREQIDFSRLANAHRKCIKIADEAETSKDVPPAPALPVSSTKPMKNHKCETKVNFCSGVKVTASKIQPKERPSCKQLPTNKTVVELSDSSDSDLPLSVVRERMKQTEKRKPPSTSSSEVPLSERLSKKCRKSASSTSASDVPLSVRLLRANPAASASGVKTYVPLGIVLSRKSSKPPSSSSASEMPLSERFNRAKTPASDSEENSDVPLSVIMQRRHATRNMHTSAVAEENSDEPLSMVLERLCNRSTTIGKKKNRTNSHQTKSATSRNRRKRKSKKKSTAPAASPKTRRSVRARGSRLVTLRSGTSQESPTLPSSQSSGVANSPRLRPNYREEERARSRSAASSRRQAAATTRLDQELEIFHGDRDPPPPRPHPPTHCRYVGVEPTADNVHKFDLGYLVRECSYCGAKFLQKEVPENENVFSLCCMKGKVPPFTRRAPVPELIQDLFLGETRQSREFLRNARAYNNMLAMVSLAAQIHTPENSRNFIFQLQGQVYHRFSSYRPPTNKDPACAQLYMLDTVTACSLRRQIAQNQIPLPMLEELDRLLRECNPYVEGYVKLYEQLRIQAESEVLRRRRASNAGNPHHVNLPKKTSKLALVMQTKDQRDRDPGAAEPLFENDVVAVYSGELPIRPSLVVRDDRSTREIDYENEHALPLQYPMLFPCGTPGWRMNLHHDPQHATPQRNHVTFRQFQTSLLMLRREKELMHRGGNLKMQYLVNVGAIGEQRDLEFLKQNQQRFLQTRRDVLENIPNLPEEERDVGRVVVLPATFNGCYRNKRKNYLDETTIARNVGNPSLFITFTLNHKWPEFDRLEPYASKQHCHDIYSRVFHAKVQHFIKLIKEDEVFGRLKHYTIVIEWTKSGLPHAHCILTLVDADKYVTPEEVDAVVKAVLPDPVEQPELFRAVTEYNLHNKCYKKDDKKTAKCLDEKGKCTKGFPKSFRDTTEFVPKVGRYFYRRPQNGASVRKKGRTYTNRHVVSYNPILLLELDCHCNVEVIGEQFVFWYLYKYIEKAPGQRQFEVHEWDEVRQGDQYILIDEIIEYLTMRILSASEAAWLTFRFPMRFSMHSVVLLHIHLENEEPVYFREGEADAAAERPQKSKLLAYFQLCQRDAKARTLLYVEIIRFYWFEERAGVWLERKKFPIMLFARVADVSIRRVQLFALKLLLSVIRGVISFEYVRTYEGIVYETFKEACVARRLLNEDQMSRRAMAIAVTYKNHRQILKLFGQLMVFDVVCQVQELFDEFKQYFMHDFMQRSLSAQQAEARVKKAIGRAVLRAGGNLADYRDFFAGVHVYMRDVPLPPIVARPDGEEEQPEDSDDEDVAPPPPEQVQERVASLNAQQTVAFEAIMEGVRAFVGGEKHTKKCYMVEAPAGCGKTFLYNCVLDRVKLLHKTAVVCAWSGIAASLLKGGTTCHNAFKLPLEIDNNSSSLMDPAVHKYQWENIVNCGVVLIDEVSMLPAPVVRMMDAVLRRAHNAATYMGGVPVVFGGDFRQIMPVGDEFVSAKELSLRTTNGLASFTQFTLAENQRADPGHRDFAEYLLSIGNGTHARIPAVTNHSCAFQVPPECVAANTAELIDRVFQGDPLANAHNSAILSPLNKNVDDLNRMIIAKLPGEEVVLLSENKDSQPDHGDIAIERVTIEQMQAANPPGYPPHELRLKKGVIVILLRNLDVQSGQCNGSRFIVNDINKDLLVVEYVGGTRAGKTCFIPKLEFQMKMRGMVTFQRIQFPIRLAYAVTINKAQGQSFHKVGLYLPLPVFAHGQMYVAMSRVSRLEDFTVLVSPRSNVQGTRGNVTFTSNIVDKALVRGPQQ